jgi:hypothetical protein
MILTLQPSKPGHVYAGWCRLRVIPVITCITVGPKVTTCNYGQSYMEGYSGEGAKLWQISA